jgi:hypothetical protein
VFGLHLAGAHATQPPATAPTVQRQRYTVADAAPGLVVWPNPAAASGRAVVVTDFRRASSIHRIKTTNQPNETWHLELSMHPYLAFRQP